MSESTTAKRSAQQAVTAARRTGESLPSAAEYLKQYARERPDVAALWCFGIGFVLGWKLKIW